jgi:hypothetical protein
VTGYLDIQNGRILSGQPSYNKFKVHEYLIRHEVLATAVVLRERIKDALPTIVLKQAILILKQENYHKAKGISDVWRQLIASK